MYTVDSASKQGRQCENRVVIKHKTAALRLKLGAFESSARSKNPVEALESRRQFFARCLIISERWVAVCYLLSIF